MELGRERNRVQFVSGKLRTSKNTKFQPSKMPSSFEFSIKLFVCSLRWLALLGHTACLGLSTRPQKILPAANGQITDLVVWQQILSLRYAPINHWQWIQLCIGRRA
jgi:hypothetical protein